MDRVGKKSTSNLGAAIKVRVNTGRTDFRLIYKEREESDKVNYAYTESKCMNVMKARQKCWEKKRCCHVPFFIVVLHGSW